MSNETLARWIAWFVARAAYGTISEVAYSQYRDVIVALMHYANGTALSRDYRAIRGY